MSVFLCKENVRETLVSQGISLTTSHNTFLYIRCTAILNTRSRPLWAASFFVLTTFSKKYAIMIKIYEIFPAKTVVYS